MQYFRYLLQGFLGRVQSRMALSFAIGILAVVLLGIWGDRLPSLGNAAVAQVSNTPALDAAQIRTLLAELDVPLNPEPYRPSNLTQSDIRGIIGDDDRIVISEEVSRNYPWSALGRVVGFSPSTPANSIGVCTGSLIKADIVLTNAHCVVDESGSGEESQAVWFLPNLYNGTLKDGANFEQVWKLRAGQSVDIPDLAAVQTMVYGTRFQPRNDVAFADDWALLKLDRPLGEAYGTIGWKSIAENQLRAQQNGTLVLAGYHEDFPKGKEGLSLGFHKGCSFTRLHEDALLHDCDTIEGSSGSPILGWVNNNYQAVALNNAWYPSLNANKAVQMNRVERFLKGNPARPVYAKQF